jgi:hypothetical protein
MMWWLCHPVNAGDFLVAEWAETALLFPEIKQFPFSLQVLCHFHIETFIML